MTKKAHALHTENDPECIWCQFENSEEARQAVWDVSRKLGRSFEEIAEQAQKLMVILAKMGEHINTEEDVK